MPLKMKEHHFDLLSNRCNEVIDDVGRKYLLSVYRSRNIPRADSVKDINKRFSFDIFHVVRRRHPGLVDELYSYLDHDHIYSALKKVIPRIEE